MPGTVVTRAPSDANRAYLADGYLERVEAQYGGSRLGRQEIQGELLDDVDGALWRYEMLDACRTNDAGPLDRVVVAVDPSVSDKASSDECGILVVGAVTAGPPQDWRAYVLEDATVPTGSPLVWARAVEALADAYAADRVVAEVNQGGALVESVLRQVNPMLPYRAVHAGRAKAARAEPVAALYEQKRVFHCGTFAELEDQMCQMTRRGFVGSGSPDRVDALVWALTDLMLEPSQGYRKPRLRSL